MTVLRKRLRSGDHRGFTLVEVMIVVAIIGLLAVLAIPSFVKARQESRISAFINDLRIAVDSFEVYALNEGKYPDDVLRATIPAGMEPYLAKMRWTEPTSLGGNWDWERNAVGVGAGVSVVGFSVPHAVFQTIDERIDDGDITSGSFRRNGGRYTYVIESL